LLGRQAPGNRDYIEYWASGQQLIHGGNPYDPTSILQLERSVGFPSGLAPMVMGNAPPALLLTAPLGLVGVEVGQRLWMALLLACFLVAVRLVCDTLGATAGYVGIMGYSFAPALVCLAAGQMAIFVLLGIALFLRFHQTKPLFAGAAIWFCLLKPQLFLPFGFVMVVWIWRTRRFEIIAGAVAALSISAAVVSTMDRNCWAEYVQMMRTMRYGNLSIPCFSMTLRDILHGGALVQYAPAVLGSVWGITYFWRHRFRWQWTDQGSLVLLVSLLVAPYTWLLDQCVAVPALLRGLHASKSRTLIFALALAGAIIEIAPLTGRDVLHSNFYLWTAPAWLIWYALVQMDNTSRCRRVAQATGGQLPALGRSLSGVSE
jgi:hypothetical protein